MWVNSGQRGWVSSPPPEKNGPLKMAPPENGTPCFSSSPLFKIKISQPPLQNKNFSTPPLFPRLEFHTLFFFPGLSSSFLTFTHKLLQSISIFQRLLK